VGITWTLHNNKNNSKNSARFWSRKSRVISHQDERISSPRGLFHGVSLLANTVPHIAKVWDSKNITIVLICSLVKRAEVMWTRKHALARAVYDILTNWWNGMNRSCWPDLIEGKRSTGSRHQALAILTDWLNDCRPAAA
jgi:hypothetical protein